MNDLDTKSSSYLLKIQNELCRVDKQVKRRKKYIFPNEQGNAANVFIKIHIKNNSDPIYLFAIMAVMEMVIRFSQRVL